MLDEQENVCFEENYILYVLRLWWNVMTSFHYRDLSIDLLVHHIILLDVVVNKRTLRRIRKCVERRL